MKLEVARCSDYPAWDRFVAESEQGSAFCQAGFLQGVSPEFDLWWVLEEGQPAAAAVLLKEKGIPLPGPSSYCMYQGILLAGQTAALPLHRRAGKILLWCDALLRAIEGEYPQMSFSLHPLFQDVRALQWFHYDAPEAGVFQLSISYTGILRLAAIGTKGEYLENIRENRAREYKRAQSAGFAVEDSEDVDLLNAMLSRTFARQEKERPPEEISLLKKLATNSLEKGIADLRMCRDAEGEPASMSMFLTDPRGAYYLIGANEPHKRSSGSATFLMLESIFHYHDQGKEFVDFCGVNSPNRGDYKCSFNAEVVPCYHALWRRPA